MRGAWLVGLCVMVVMSLLPGTSAPIVWLSPISDKLLHFVAYAVLAVLAGAGAANRRAAILPMVVMAVLGVALDCAQELVPGRGFQWSDVAADESGVLCGVLAGFWVARGGWTSQETYPTGPSGR